MKKQSATRSKETIPFSFSRRHFLKAALFTGAGAPWILNSNLGAASSNSRLAHACIGVGGMGANDLQQFQQHSRTQVVAICDVDAGTLERAAKTVPGVRTYTDWRELLEKEGDKIDSINVTVPDHMHFPIAYSAIQRGKHVYVQKPMCHDVSEVRLLTEASVKKGVITQLGTQMASGLGDLTTVQLLRSGVIGKINHVYLCSNRPGAVETYRLKGPRPGSGTPPPAHLNWDLWIGTAPMRPFVPDIYHATKWRAWLDFGTGWSGDIGCHVFDAVWKGLLLKPAQTVQAEVQESWKNSPERRADNWPQGDHITWTFPGNKLTGGKELTIEWFDGEYYPPKEIRALYTDKMEEYPTESAMVIGTDGALLLPIGTGPILLPDSKFAGFKKPEVPRRNHYHHFMDAILGVEKNESFFAQTGPMTEAILLGTVAIRLPGEKLKWDSKNLKVKNSKDANRLLKRTYRSGWEIKGV